MEHRFNIVQRLQSFMSESTAERHPEREYLDAVRELEPAGTSEVAERVGVERQSADYRLRKLEESGRVRSKKIGNSLAWLIEDTEIEASDIDPDDPFWELEPGASGKRDVSENVDEALYRT
jgi:DNA-binding MarR family transcriptional regulator